MTSKIDFSWNPIVSNLYKEPLASFFQSYVFCYPNKREIFKLFEKELKHYKVVILKEEPYKTFLGDYKAFSSKLLTRELSFIYKELPTEPKNDDWINLKHWEEQGVLLLHTSLTTGPNDSHSVYWENFTKDLIKFISNKNPCIWLFWGNAVKNFITDVSNPFLVDNYTLDTIKQIPSVEEWNYILTAPYPGELGFTGCKHLEYTNIILKRLNKKIINW